LIGYTAAEVSVDNQVTGVVDRVELHPPNNQSKTVLV
jgi:hypothetical protein